MLGSLAAAVLGVSSCASPFAGDDTPADGGTPVSFAAQSGWNNVTDGGNKAEDGTRLAEGTDGTAFERGDAIGVFAYKNDSSTPDFMNNQSVMLDKTDTWTYSPIKYWPTDKGDRLSFYAYYPWRESTDKEVIVIDANSSEPILTYNSQDEETDLLTAYKKDLYYISGDASVKLSFEHQLSKIRFCFRNAWIEKSKKYHLGINYLHLSCESNSTLTYDYGADNATYTNPKTKIYNPEIVNIDDYFPYSDSKYYDIVAPYYFVPGFIRNGTIELGIDVFEFNDNVGKWVKTTEHNTPTYILKATLPENANLQKGTSVAYNISYKPESGIVITMITDVDGWETIDNDNRI